MVFKKLGVKSWLGVISSWLEPVPPNATVIFEVEAYAVTRGPRTMEAFGQMDINKDRSLTKEEVTTIYKLVMNNIKVQHWINETLKTRVWLAFFFC